MKLDVNHYIHFVDDGSRAEIISKLNLLLKLGDRIMHTLDETLELVTSEKTDIASLASFIAGLKQQLKDALAGSITPEVQAKIDAVFDQAAARKQEIADALAENVTPTP